MMLRSFLLALLALLALTACDQRDAQRDAIEAADRKAKISAWREAIRGYESALDGTAKTASLHYKIAVLYDDKLKEPLHAIHHYERFLDYVTEGSQAKEARTARADCERRLQVALQKEGIMTTGEAARLRNENEALRKIIADLRNPKPTPEPKRADPSIADAMPPGAKRYQVARGDTLAGIALKFYKNRAYADHIKDANFNQLGGKDLLRPGMILIIPEAPGKKR